jgi:methylenetetrahydrofolate reductase (NADPH)
MPSLLDLYRSSRPVLSFELFPPKTEEAARSLWQHLPELVRCRPAFVTCTYGAGGSTRQLTLEILSEIRSRYPGLPLASHLTCWGNTRTDIRAYLQRAQRQEIEFIVALRGDPPRDAPNFQPPSDELKHAVDLVRLIHDEFPNFGVLVAGYPEKHPEAPSLEADVVRLKEKVEAGAHVVLTQLFYDNSVYFRYRDLCTKMGITVPIVPGILPITSFTQVKRIVQLCGAHMPSSLVERLERYADDEESQFAVGVYHAAKQGEGLLAEGVAGVHFYVLNRSRAVTLICRALALA